MSDKVCPTCGHVGDQEYCPEDGSPLVVPDEAPGGTVSDADPTGSPPTRMARRQHAPAAGLDGDEALRGEDFGNWAAPEVRKKPKDPMVGRVIAGRYEVIGLIGQGGMGAVYKARQPSVQRMIALKILLQEFAENETIIKRFHQEALAASRLTHPNTIRVFDFGQTDDGVLYMAMELLRGESLAQALARGGPMPPRRAVFVMRQVCKSLAEAHKAGIIHRDLKPDNIFLTEIEGERDFVKVLDFGVAKLREYEGKDGTLTQAGMIFGTPKYMSPEQARSGELDGRSDVYALGVILYEMLMGRAPFTGDNPLSILIAHVNEKPSRFQHFNPAISVPAPVEAVVFKALAKDREFRHPSVEALLAELEACDELLGGASYDRVADRLPVFAPGADGSPSLMGPGIVPAGTEGTSPGQAIGRDGGTMVLEGAEPPPPVVTLPPPDEAPRRGASPWIALGLAVPATAAAAWWFLGRSPEIVTPEAEPPVVAALDAGRAPVVVSAPPAPPSLAAAAPSAPATEAEPVPASEPDRPRPPRTFEFVLNTQPDGVTVTDDAGTRVGVAKPTLRVRIGGPAEYRLSKSGYEDEVVRLVPGQAQKVVSVKLRPQAVAEPTPKIRVEGRPASVAAPATAAPVKDIDLQ